ncbi:hypothetical protein HOB10_03540 [Candidatus Parcubacteria bacterium]|jgi:hypothetical protein|nr:hypothetical protein [Candidatus Parcubacteria bacterium]
MHNVINHCELYREVQGSMDTADFQEAVMTRAGEIVEAAKNGQTSDPHNLRGVEIVAWSVAQHVLNEGARQIASDLGVEIDRLKRQASSQHISSC